MLPSHAHSHLFAALIAAFAILTTDPAFAETGPSPRDTAGDLLGLETGISQGYLPVGENAEFHARVNVEADDVRTEDRAPLNLAVVIDRSGSMRGDRLAQAKRAAHRLVDRLAPRDRLAIVEYGSEVEVAADSQAVSAGNQDRFHAAISSIGCDGSTYLEGGFDRGRSIVQTHADDETIDRVILLSDGKANRGADTARALGRTARTGLEAGVSATTMGLGLDYDEKIMTAIAEMGGGNHYFIEHEKEIAKMFGREFESLASVVARDAYLVLELGDGIELLDVHGFSHRRSDDGNVVVELGSMYARQQRDALIDLAASSGEKGRRPVMDVHLHFEDVTGEEDQKVTNTASVVAVGTSDPDKLARIEPWVMRRVEHIAYAETLEEANEAYEKGNRERAQKIIEDEMERLDRAADREILDRKKVQGKKKELEQKKSTMRRSRASGSAGKRLQKKSADEQLKLEQNSSAF